MDPSYLWQQPPHQDPGSSSEHLQTSQGLLQTNGTTRTSHTHQSSSTGWNADFGYVNGRLNPQAVQQAIPRQMYDPSWDTYGIYTDFDPNAALGIDPSTLMTAPNPSSASDPPTTIDPNLMMKSSQASLPQFISPSQTQLDPSQYTQPGYSTVYPLSAATSSLSAVMDYPVQDPMAPSTPTVSTSTRNGEPNGFHSTSEPLINQVKRILAPKKLDQDPNGTAAQLFELILPPTSEDSTSTTAITVDKEARMEILNRIRDYAPKEFWNQFGKNLRALNLLREWGRQASKKEEFTDTMMGWLQVVDKLPLTVEILIQSQLGKVVKWIVDHPPTKATKDMASKIKTNWEQLASAPQSESINSVKTAKKRKDETPAVKTPVAAGSPVTSGVTPPLKKLALTTDDSLAKTILLGSQIEELLQARQDETPSATHWLGQLGNGLDSSFGANAGNVYAAAVEGGQAQPGQEGIAELLSKIMQSIPQTGGAQPPQDPYAGVAAAYGGGQPAAGDPAAAALLSALSALGGVPAQGYGAYGAGGDVYGGTTPSTVYGSGATGGLQPHAPTGTSAHDEEEERWRRSSKVDAKKTKAKQVPASQNTWRPLCTYFARGRCRFGENCDFSHDPAKLNQGS
ncbi:hypothetical protein FRB91_005421 [Serendipita sp. 411]|nr:hypothetical protein FRB91_005421 [Serendipita sp. 411]